MRNDDPAAYNELHDLAETVRAQYKRVGRAALSNDDLNHCPKWIPFAHAVVSLLFNALIIYAFHPHTWAYFVASIPLLYGLWDLKSAIFDSQQTLDDKLSGNWYPKTTSLNPANDASRPR